MDLIFCTIFDSNYLDKGLVLYDSMVTCMRKFKLYIFAFDEKCKEILEKEKLKNVVIVGIEEFETAELVKAKSERTRAEYCWTCTPWSIKYVLEKYNEEICTYIDADMMFFSSPQIVFDEMRRRNCSSIIVPHRFKNDKAEKKAYDTVGKYCVEFNTFKNDENGMEALNWWADRCLEWCYYAVPGTTEWYGDQKYLNVFPDKFKGVMVCNHYGVGLGSWNACLVDDGGIVNGEPYIRIRTTNERVPIIIHHFEGICFLTNRILHTPSGIRSKKLHKNVYDVYVKKIIEKRIYLEKEYAYKMMKSRRVVTKNPIMIIYQKYFSPLRRIRSLNDIYWVK